MTAILMTPQQMPSRFSLAEEAEPASHKPVRRGAGVAERLAATAARLRRLLAAPPLRHRDSSAAAW